MECTPESGHCHSECTLCRVLPKGGGGERRMDDEL
jgi:hypothetical protein